MSFVGNNDVSQKSPYMAGGEGWLGVQTSPRKCDHVVLRVIEETFIFLNTDEVQRFFFDTFPQKKKIIRLLP